MDKDVSWLARAAGFDPASQEAQAFWKEVENYLRILKNDPCAQLPAALEEHRKEDA